MYLPKSNVKNLDSAKNGPKAIVKKTAPEYKFQKKEENKFKFKYCDQNQKKSPLKSLSITQQENKYSVEIEALCNFEEVSLNFNPAKHIFKLGMLGFEEIGAYKPEKGAKIYFQREDLEKGELENILSEINC